VRESAPALDGTVALALPPLTEAQVASFVTSLGAIPRHEPWAASLERGLHLATSGSPLLLLQLLKLALERGTLQLEQGTWRCADPEALGRMLREGEAMRNRLDALPREQRWLVTTLAIAGIPLSAAALSHASGRGPDAVLPDLEELERLGLVLRSGGDWDLAHDEIGTVASESLSATAEQSAHRGIGGALLVAAETDPVLLMRAARHLAVPGDIAGLARCARSYVRALRLRGDGRNPNALVQEVLGPSATPELRRAVAAQVPLRWKLGLWNRARMTAAGLGAAVLALIAAASLLAPKPAGPTMELVLFTRTDTGYVALSAGLDLANWSPQQPLRPVERPRLSAGVPREATALRFSPDGKRLLATHRSGDETTDDLLLVEDGKAHYLTNELRDDLHGVWSPDGRWIAFLTARWSPVGADDYDLAILDPVNGQARPVTKTRDWDLGMAWSPDGSRIAFARRYKTLQPGRACVIGFDGSGEECHAIAGLDVSGVVGWLDPATLVVAGERLAQRLVVELDLESGESRTLLSGDVQDASVSPDGTWLLCICSRGTDDQPAAWIMPPRSATPSQMRRVSGNITSQPAWRTRAPLHWMDSLHVADVTMPRDGVGTPELMPVTQDGQRLVVPRGAFRWAVEDTTIATVDGRTGQITPRREGTTWLTVTASGWRDARARLTIAPPTLRTVLVDSTWDLLDTLPTATGTWRLYGAPLPRRVDSAGGPAISNNGDGSYSSGIYTRETFPASDGIGIEAVVSVPVTKPQWQIQTIQLQTDRYAAVEEWNHRSGGPPPTSWSPEVCSAGYPGGEGSNATSLMGLIAGGVGERVPAPRPYRDGRWFRLRIQIFSDGKCGVAVDGEPLWIGSVRMPLDRPYRALLGGNSAETTVRIRKVEMWVGVRGDVRW
jgi:hypothetical protein